MSWFGAQRRSSSNVEYINSQLNKVGLRTVPSYLDIWVDAPITFEMVADHPDVGIPDNSEQFGEQASVHQDARSEPEEKSASDPSFRIGKIASANKPPLSVSPSATLQEAKTLMFVRNFSQLPVMTSEREVKGVISWESIGVRSATQRDNGDVQSYMDDPHEVPYTASLFVAIKTIVEHGYVLIRASDKKISGIVTATDIALQFEEISAPFLLLAEIENNIRILIDSKLEINDVKKACSEEYLPKDFSKISELTFGNYVRVLENVENWNKLGLQLDRKTFCKSLDDINLIRNDVMHFDPDPLTDISISKLREVSRMFDTLRNIKAF